MVAPSEQCAPRPCVRGAERHTVSGQLTERRSCYGCRLPAWSDALGPCSSSPWPSLLSALLTPGFPERNTVASGPELQRARGLSLCPLGRELQILVWSPRTRCSEGPAGSARGRAGVGTLCTSGQNLCTAPTLLRVWSQEAQQHLELFGNADVCPNPGFWNQWVWGSPAVCVNRLSG